MSNCENAPVIATDFLLAIATLSRFYGDEHGGFCQCRSSQK